MDERQTARRLLRWLLPIYVAFTVLWIVALVVSITVFGESWSVGRAVQVALSGFSALLGLYTGWRVRREDRAAARDRAGVRSGDQ